MALKSPLQIFVRIGALKRFHALREKTRALPVHVAWDRRRTDRRTASSGAPSDRRQGDRRADPPFTWTTADFVVVQEPEDQTD